MQPLFKSTSPDARPPWLRWYIPDRKEIVGKLLYLAGPPVGINTHRVGRRTWPCLNEFPALNWECPHCDRARRFTTWVPCITCEGPRQQIVIMGATTTWESVKTIRTHTFVRAAFCLELKPTIKILPDKLQLGKTSMGEVLRLDEGFTGDITRWLLHYWQWEELSRRFGEKYRESIKRRTARERAQYHGVIDFAMQPPVAS